MFSRHLMLALFAGSIAFAGGGSMLTFTTDAAQASSDQEAPVLDTASSQ